MSAPAPAPAPSQVTRHRVPDHLKAAVVLLGRLFDSGVIGQVPAHYWVRRRLGTTVVDAVVFLVAFFSTPKALWGLRGFYDANHGWRTVIAGAAGQSKLASPSGLSRFLRDVGTEGLSEFGSWLLREGSGCLDLMRSCHVQTLDGQGNYWQVLNFDPTRTAVRRRALLEDDAYPDGVRRLEGLCAPGHFGRKRGETGWSEHVLHHHGTGLVLQTTVGAGNGCAHSQFQAALSAAKDLAVAVNHPLSRVLVRADGEFGQTSFLADARRAGVQVLTRCSRYSAVLSDEELRRRLAGHTWERVKDSGSGPRRYAMSLGAIELAVEDGEPPIVARLVASRFTQTSERGVGHSIDGERLELFMCLGLDQSAWSAGDIVTIYYGRIAQENRFAQADREVKGRAYSDSVGGEQLACIVAGLIWNLRIVEGARLAPVGTVPPQAVTAREPDLVQMKSLLANDPPPEQLDSPDPAVPHEPDVEVGDGTVDAMLAKLDIGGRADRKGLVWDSERRTLTSGHDTFASAMLEKHHGSFRLRFVNLAGRRISLSLTADEGRELQPVWSAERRPSRPSLAKSKVRGNESLTLSALPLTSSEPPPFELAHPAFLPAAARRILTEKLQFEVITVVITVHARPDHGHPHPLIQRDPDRRRHQRYSLAERIARRQRAPWINLSIRRSEPSTSRIPSLGID